MKLENLRRKVKSKKKKRLGRGIAAGGGKTGGRGTKGEKARSGYRLPRHFEGGQTPLIRRLPKRKGFRSRKKKPLIINLAELEKDFSSRDKVSPESLFKKGLIRDPRQKVKILGKGKLTKRLKIEGCLLSQSVSKIIEKTSRKDQSRGAK